MKDTLKITPHDIAVHITAFFITLEKGGVNFNDTGIATTTLMETLYSLLQVDLSFDDFARLVIHEARKVVDVLEEDERRKREMGGEASH